MINVDRAPASISRVGAARTWRDWHELRPDLFPLPLELRDKPGLIGYHLNKIPLELVRDASRCPDPWLDLASIKFLSCYRSLFLSCASLLPAWLTMASCGWGGATSPNAKRVIAHRVRKARMDGDERTAQRLERKIIDAMLRFDRTRLEEISKNFCDDGNLSGLGLLVKESYNTAKRSIRTTDKQAARDRLCTVEVIVAVNWILLGNCGDPGLAVLYDSLTSKPKPERFPSSQKFFEISSSRVRSNRNIASMIFLSSRCAVLSSPSMRAFLTR